MIYGFYLSAAGVIANAHRQDVIANNLANSETVAFKKDVPLFQERLTAAQEMRGRASWSDPLANQIGGGLFASPTAVDQSGGEMEPTDNPLDLAIDGKGFFAVEANGQKQLTRDGRLTINRDGYLARVDNPSQRLLDSAGNPIKLDGTLRAQTYIGDDGQVSQKRQSIARIGLFKVSDESKLKKLGGGLMSNPDGALAPSEARLRAGFVERANVDPATELAALMDTQRLLEANANMIRYQDQTLDKLVNTVGKVA